MRTLLALTLTTVSVPATAGGLAFEAGAGGGLAQYSAAGGGAGNTLDGIALGGSVTVAAGGWIGPKVALSGAATAIGFFAEGATTGAGVVGPVLRIQVGERTWLSLGASITRRGYPGFGFGIEGRLGFEKPSGLTVAFALGHVTLPNGVNPALDLGDDTYLMLSVQLLYQRPR